MARDEEERATEASPTEPSGPRQSEMGGGALTTCPSCGYEVNPREASYGVTDPSVGLVCPNCGASLGGVDEPHPGQLAAPEGTAED